MTVGTRPLGMVIRSLYPLSYASWQDTVFHVTGIGPLPGIQPDISKSKKIDKELYRQPDLLKKAYHKIKDQLEEMGQLIEDWEEDENGEPVTSLNIVVPQKVDLRLDTSLDVVYCSGCGLLNRLSKLGRNPQGGLPFHKNCTDRGRFKQAPIFVPKPSSDETIGLSGEPGAVRVRSINSRQIMCYYLRPGGTCDHPQSKDKKCVTHTEGQLSYLKINKKRPISGLRIINERCPKQLRGIPEQKLFSPRVGAGHFYSKKFPSPGITNPLFISIANEDFRQNPEIETINSYIDDVKKTLFNNKYVSMEKTHFSKIDVMEIVYGIRFGGARYGSYTEHWLRGGENNNVLGRMMKTQGFVLTIKPEIYSKIDELIPQFKRLEEKENPKRYALDVIAHTLKHALLVLVPRFTGFEDQKFMGTYEVFDNEEGAKVYLYDNENGGHGGFATLIKQKDSFARMIGEISRTRIHCPVRECNHACGNCLFIRRCGRVNRELNRRLLIKSEILHPQL